PDPVIDPVYRGQRANPLRRSEPDPVSSERFHTPLSESIPQISQMSFASKGAVQVLLSNAFILEQVINRSSKHRLACKVERVCIFNEGRKPSIERIFIALLGHDLDLKNAVVEVGQVLPLG